MTQFKLSTLTLATAVAASVAAPVVAQDWSGAYVGGSAGYTWGNADGGTNAVTDTYTNPVGVKTDNGTDLDYVVGGKSYNHVFKSGLKSGDYIEYNTLPPIGGNHVLFRDDDGVLSLSNGLKSALVGSQSSDPSGGDVALHAGYRWQTGNMVYGAELGYAFRDIDDGAFNIGNTATLRGTLGVDMNGTLLFGALGVSSADVDINTGYYQSSGRETGFNIGVGAERMIASNWSLRGEVIYTDFGSQSFSHAESFDPGSVAVTRAGSGEWDLSTTEVRVGLNYQF